MAFVRTNKEEMTSFSQGAEQPAADHNSTRMEPDFHDNPYESFSSILLKTTEVTENILWKWIMSVSDIQ